MFRNDKVPSLLPSPPSFPLPLSLFLFPSPSFPLPLSLSPYISTHLYVYHVCNKCCSPGLVIAGVERLVQSGSGASEMCIGVLYTVQGLGLRA